MSMGIIPRCPICSSAAFLHSPNSGSAPAGEKIFGGRGQRRWPRALGVFVDIELRGVLVDVELSGAGRRETAPPHPPSHTTEIGQIPQYTSIQVRNITNQCAIPPQVTFDVIKRLREFKFGAPGDLQWPESPSGQ